MQEEGFYLDSAEKTYIYSVFPTLAIFDDSNYE